jgi:hypothetical protein
LVAAGEWEEADEEAKAMVKQQCGLDYAAASVVALHLESGAMRCRKVVSGQGRKIMIALPVFVPL